MKIYSHYFELKEGLGVDTKSLRIDNSPGYKLYVAAYEASGKIKCWSCGLEANCWVADKHKNDLVSRPTLNPYALDKTLTMMNRDHIIPRSLGGLNVLENLRVACETCNSLRANSLDAADKKFILSHPHLFNRETFEKNRENMEAMIKRNIYPKAIKNRIRKPFNEIEKLFKLNKAIA